MKNELSDNHSVKTDSVTLTGTADCQDRNPDQASVEPVAETEAVPEKKSKKRFFRKKQAHEACDADESHKSAEQGFSIPRFSRIMRPKRREKIVLALEGKDIRYRGPLSYRHLRILAWIMCALSACGSILMVTYRFVPDLLPVVKDVGTILSSLTSFALPLFMLANFAVILNVREGYRHLLISYAVFSLMMYAGFLFVLSHYVLGTFEIFLKSRYDALVAFSRTMGLVFHKGYISFNIFIDLFLCTLFSFFLSYQPKRFFRGKWHILFRWFAVLPILYEMACLVFKFLDGFGIISMPYYVWPLLTTKPPVVFIIFLAIAIYIKKRERSFRKSGFTHTEYVRYLKSNRNSLQFSLHVFLIFIVCSIIDIALLLTLPAILAVLLGNVESQELAMHLYIVIIDIGIGTGLILLIVSPIVLLFSYTKTYRNRMIDRLIPVGGVALVILFSIELIYQMLRMVPNL